LGNQKTKANKAEGLGSANVEFKLENRANGAGV